VTISDSRSRKMPWRSNACCAGDVMARAAAWRSTCGVGRKSGGRVRRGWCGQRWMRRGGRGVTVDLRAELLVAARRGDDDPRPALDTAPIHSQTRSRSRSQK